MLRGCLTVVVRAGFINIWEETRAVEVRNLPNIIKLNRGDYTTLYFDFK